MLKVVLRNSWKFYRLWIWSGRMKIHLELVTYNIFTWAKVFWLPIHRYNVRNSVSKCSFLDCTASCLFWESSSRSGTCSSSASPQSYFEKFVHNIRQPVWAKCIDHKRTQTSVDSGIFLNKKNTNTGFLA